MKLYIMLKLTIFLLVMSSPVFADKPVGSEYLAGSNKNALILAHGRAKYPTWKVVDPLRKGVHDKLGYHTLSLQMPNDDKEWRQYADDFPDAYEIIKAGIRYLKEEKGVTKIFLMGHSMGSRMASAFVSDNPDQTLAGLIVVGCRNNGGYPLSCKENLENVDMPVLDLWGGDNGKDSDAASNRQEFVSENYTQVEISGANHKLDDYDRAFIAAVVNWLKTQ